MTFTIQGFCSRSGKVGFAQATSTPAVGWRCTDIVVGRGVVSVQAHADFRQLQAAKQHMASGLEPSQVMKKLAGSDPFFAYRQVAVLGLDGTSAVYTGPEAHSWAGEVVGQDHIATGNVLAGRHVVEAMSEAFAGARAMDLEDRLMVALEAGRDAGGQPDGQTSAAIVVYEKYAFPIVNLRVDVSVEPVAELRKVFSWFKPLISYYVDRTLDPGSVPRYRAVLAEKNLKPTP